MTEEQILNNYQPIPYCGCWIWDGCLNPDGYGNVIYKGKIQRAHRVMYELIKGKIPAGIFVLHKCDQPSCVNPDHLFLGTQKDNMADCVIKGRIAGGSKCGRAKLTENKVREIRELLNAGYKFKVLAEMYSVVTSTISDIKMGKSWRSVDAN